MNKEDKDFEYLKTIHIPSVGEFLSQEFGNVDWLVEGLIPTGGSAIIVAKRESYKTWQALHIAKCVSEGLQVWGVIPTQKGSVLYISNDDPPRSFQKRLDSFNFNPDVVFVYHRGLERPFSVDQENGSFESVKSLIKEKEISLVIVDILRNTHNKDSNTDKDSKLVFEKFNELRESNPNLTFIFLIHPSKEQAFERKFARRQSEEAVGSYYWEAAVDTVISLNKSTDEDIDQVAITVTKNKQSEKKIKPFVGIRRKGENVVEFIYEESITDKLKIDQAKDYILQILSDNNQTRQQIIDLAVESKICGERFVETALKELTDKSLVTHTTSKPHIYSLVNKDTVDDSANRNGIYGLRNAESLTQAEISYSEEADGK